MCITAFCQVCYSVVLYLLAPLQRYITIKDIKTTTPITSIASSSIVYI